MKNHASKFNALYRSVFEKSSRRIRDKREMLSNETIAILNHMANIGPSTLSELCIHLDRAPSTISEIIKHLEQKGFIERQNDETDKRRQFLWLSDYGFETLKQENNVLDENIIANAFDKMKGKDAESLLLLLEKFSKNLNMEV